jgi:hypothetical protein
MSADNATPRTDDQREQLAESEKRATVPGSRTWDDRNETEKVVRIDQPDPDSDRSIQGVDPEQKR